MALKQDDVCDCLIADQIQLHYYLEDKKLAAQIKSAIYGKAHTAPRSVLGQPSTGHWARCC